MNSLLIFIGVPLVAALTRRAKVYTLMVVGTGVMAGLIAGVSVVLLIVAKPWLGKDFKTKAD